MEKHARKRGNVHRECVASMWIHARSVSLVLSPSLPLLTPLPSGSSCFLPSSDPWPHLGRRQDRTRFRAQGKETPGKLFHPLLSCEPSSPFGPCHFPMLLRTARSPHHPFPFFRLSLPPACSLSKNRSTAKPFNQIGKERPRRERRQPLPPPLQQPLNGRKKRMKHAGPARKLPWARSRRRGQGKACAGLLCACLD